jgi:signal transduction histidine kinase
MAREARERNYTDLQSRLADLRSVLEHAVGASAPERRLILDRLAEIERSAETLHRATEDELRRFAHELRTPLNAIAGWTQVLRAKQGDAATVAQAADVFERNVAALARTIDAFTT